MGFELVTTPYGRAAAAALHRVVASAKAGDPLAPVTVVVPANSVGVAARRRLARPDADLGPLHPAGAGVVGVTFLTLYRLAELLGAPRLAGAGRRPVSTPVLAAAVRRVLADDPGMFAAVREHPSTEEALVRAHHELSEVADDRLAAVARRSRRAAEVVRVHRAVRSRLAEGWFEERDLFDAALAAVEADSPVLGDVGVVVLHLPERIGTPAAGLVRALAARTTVAVVAGCTGVARADAHLLENLARLGIDRDLLAAGSGTPIPPAHGTRVVSCSDADEEVRAARREIVAAARAGVPLERFAVLYATTSPYARLLHEHLTAAGIPHHGTAVRTLGESLLGRSLLALLALPDHDFRRQDVCAWFTSAPVRGADGRPVPSAAWERVTRQAGIVRGAAEWDRRLAHHVEELRRRRDRVAAPPEGDPHTHRADRAVARAEALRDFVTGLIATLAPAAVPTTWRALVDWAHGLIRAYLGDERRRAAARWPGEELEAAEKVEAALDRLACVDAVDPDPDLDVFRRTVALELDAGLGRVGRFGEGVLVGHVGTALGVELDRVVVVGLAEGTFPARVREDSLLPDHDREAAGGELPLAATRTDTDHRALLAALASTDDERILCFPRGDLRRSAERMPSRFLLDTVAARHGERLWSDDLDALRADWFSVVPSFAGSLSRIGFPATDQEWSLAALDRHERAGGDLHDHPLATDDTVLAAGIEAAEARRSARFTRFDGNLTALAAQGRLGPVTDPEVVVSATRLETWAGCPHDFLMEQVLRVEIPERPEELWDLTPLDRGSLVHDVLDRFEREVLARAEPDRPSLGAPWTAADRDRLRDLGEAACAEVEQRGLTGRRLFWHRTRAEILRDLDRFVAEDSRYRGAERAQTVASELTFGLAEGDGGPVEVPLSDGRVLRFRGAADRVDRTAAGKLVVIDYKTGSARYYDSLARGDDPCVRGTKLQLPVYGVAARRAFGDASTPVEAAYWFVSTKGDFGWVHVDLDDVVPRFDEVLRAIADGIAAGLFPARLDPPDHWWRDITYTDPDGLGSADRYREWERKRLDPVVAGYVALAEPDALDPEPDA